MTVTVTMLAPSPYFSAVAKSGNSYTSDANGIITGVNSIDINDLQGAGCKYAGNLTDYLSPLTFRTSSGATLPAAASSGIFGLSYVPGTNVNLLGEATSSNSKTDYVSALVQIPASYLGSTNPNVVVNTHFTSSGTNTSSTIAVAAYKINSAGLQTSSENLVLTAAQTITSSAADYTFTLNGAPSSGTLTGGSLIALLITGLCATSSGSNTLQINSVRFVIP